jgi:hypothetical protein
LAERLSARQAVGIDISRSMIEAARERHPGHTFVCGGAEELKTRRADLLVLLDVIEHVEDIPYLLRIAGASARLIGIKVPLERTVYTRALTAFRLKAPGSRHLETEGHLYEFAEEDVRRLIAKSGLRVAASLVTSPPRSISFHPRVRAELGAAGGIKGTARSTGHTLLERLPFSIARRVLDLIEGRDLFLMCVGRHS